MASRKRQKEVRREQQLARERAEQEARHRRDQARLLLVAAMVVVFGGVLGASFLIGGGSSSSENATTDGSSTSVPSSVTRIGGSGDVKVGQPFPDFRLTEAGGEMLTPDTLRGKPAIVWFTTSYCVPCQVGARPVAELDEELGGESFNVLVVFVDPSEPDSALTGWRDEFATDDWLVALDADNALAKAVGLQFLDSKFLLDGGGVITDIDLEVADDEYLDRVRGVVGEA